MRTTQGRRDEAATRLKEPKAKHMQLIAVLRDFKDEDSEGDAGDEALTRGRALEDVPRPRRRRVGPTPRLRDRCGSIRMAKSTMMVFQRPIHADGARRGPRARTIWEVALSDSSRGAAKAVKTEARVVNDTV